MNSLIIPDVKVQLLETVRVFAIIEEPFVALLLLVLLVDVDREDH